MTEGLPLKGLLLLVAVLAGAGLAGCDRQPTSETHSQPQAATSITGRDLDNIIQAVEDPQHPFLIGVQ